MSIVGINNMVQRHKKYDLRSIATGKSWNFPFCARIRHTQSLRFFSMNDEDITEQICYTNSLGVEFIACAMITCTISDQKLLAYFRLGKILPEEK